MADEKKLAESMQAVVKAHAIIARFHSEVAAFYEIVDELLAPEGGGTRLLPWDEPYIVWNTLRTKMTTPSEWAPWCFGRFYHDADAYPEGDDEDGATYEKLAMAFVWIYEAPTNVLLPGTTGPECVAGIAHPGTEGAAKKFWDGAYYGVWRKLPVAQLGAKDWKEGEFQELTSTFGKGTFWRARRFPLVELPTREAIDEKSATPLLDAFQASFKRVPVQP